VLASKFETYLKKERFILHHLTVVILRVEMAPSSLEKRTSKKPHVSKVVDMKEVGR
jgi:hypothetical protein